MSEILVLNCHFSTLIKANGKITCQKDIPLSTAECYKAKTGVDVNYGFNDQEINQWLGRVPVTLSKSFNFDKIDATPYFLRLSQLDTIGEVRLNDHAFSSENFHADKIFNISSALQKGPNNLTIIISGPVTEAEKRSKLADQPPNCPPEVQNGQCHVNWLRKPAYRPGSYNLKLFMLKNC